MRRMLIDSGILLSYYQQQEPLHQGVVGFFDQTAAQLNSSPSCSTTGSQVLQQTLCLALAARRIQPSDWPDDTNRGNDQQRRQISRCHDVLAIYAVGQEA